MSMSLAAIVSALVAQGCSAEQIAAAVLADERAKEARGQKLREANAERQRRHREKLRHAVTERDPGLLPPRDIINPLPLPQNSLSLSLARRGRPIAG
jgi:hypothetical protein